MRSASVTRSRYCRRGNRLVARMSREPGLITGEAASLGIADERRRLEPRRPPEPGPALTLVAQLAARHLVRLERRAARRSRTPGRRSSASAAPGAETRSPDGRKSANCAQRQRADAHAEARLLIPDRGARASPCSPSALIAPRRPRRRAAALRNAQPLADELTDRAPARRSSRCSRPCQGAGGTPALRQQAGVVEQHAIVDARGGRAGRPCPCRRGRTTTSAKLIVGLAARPGRARTRIANAVLLPGAVEQRDRAVLEDVEELPQHRIAARAAARAAASCSAAAATPTGPVKPHERRPSSCGWPPSPSRLGDLVDRAGRKAQARRASGSAPSPTSGLRRTRRPARRSG